MKKNLAVIFVLMCVCSAFAPVEAQTVLRYGSANNASGARITYYPNKKPEPEVRYVYVKPPNGGYYDEDGYYKSDKRIRRKRGGGSKIIFSAFPLHKPNFGGTNIAKPAPVYSHSPIGS